MTTRTVKASAMAACLVLIAVLFQSPVSTHHSFAMYDQTKTVTLTGVMKQFVPQANHAELHFILLAPDHKSLQKGADGKYVEGTWERATEDEWYTLSDTEGNPIAVPPGQVWVSLVPTGAGITIEP